LAEERLAQQPAAITSRRMDRTDAGLVPAVGQGSWERVVSKKYVPRSPGPIRNFQKPTEGSIRIFGTIGLGNRKGTNAMIRSDRFIAGIAIVSIIASLGYIALTLIG
jgi:hypothetical protein